MKGYRVINEIRPGMLNPHLINLTGTKGDLDLVINLANGQSAFIQVGFADSDSLEFRVEIKNKDYRLVPA